MDLDQLLADWLEANPGRGGADLIDLVYRAYEAGRDSIRPSRDAWAERAARAEAELAGRSSAAVAP